MSSPSGAELAQMRHSTPREGSSRREGAGSLRPVRLRREAIQALGVREWGRPTGMYVGKAWRSKERGTMSAILPRGSDRCGVETRRLVEVAEADQEWVPATWRRAAVQYCKAWPSSAGAVAYWAALTLEERRELVLQLNGWFVENLTAVTELERALDWTWMQARTLALWAGDYRRL